MKSPSLASFCDHSLGYLYDYSHQEEILASNINDLTLVNTDRRRGMMRMYDYCPNCGHENNWKLIRKEL